MKITEKEVQTVSNLARISLSKNEVKHYSEQLEQILEFIDKLNELDVENIEPTTTILEVKNVKREDIVQKKYTTDELLKNAPKKQDSFFVVPQVIKG